MSEFDEILESERIEKKQVPELVKVLSIISYVGNGFWALAFFIIMILVFSNNSVIDEMTQGRLDIGGMGGIIAGAFLFVIGMCAICIVGAYKMHQGKKNGFIYYAIGNSIWALLLFAGNGGQITNIIIGLISVGFVLGFASKLKELR